MADELEIGTVLGHYFIASKLGSGGMGEVYLATDTSLDRRVALKILHTGAAADAERVHRFVQEAKAASALNHPNILTVHEIGTHDGSHYMATEFIKGETLRDKLRAGPIDLRETLDIAFQIAAALNAAHEAGIVHRDIKPENVMIRGDGFIKVLDFGLAKLTQQFFSTASGGTGGSDAADDTVVNTMPGMLMGTFAYMSPEQARVQETDARSDIWSLGVVLHEMVARRKPFGGDTPGDILVSILDREPAPLEGSVPPELDRIIHKALQKDRDARYHTVAELSADLKNLKQELDLSLTDPPRYTTRTQAGAKLSAGLKKKNFALLAAVLVVIAVTAGAILGLYLSFFADNSSSINSVAVLPFVNEGGDENSEYLSDGLSDQLINNLSQLPQLKVIARSSAFRYKGKEVDFREVANALGVEAIVTGRVTMRGDSINIFVEMINAADSTQIWGETYNRKVSDAQDIQEAIVRRISEKLRVKLSGAQEQQLAKEVTQNAEAYQLYLNGVYYRRKGGFENGRKALEYHDRALALDPNFALAHAAAADVYSFLGGNSLIDPQEARTKGKAAVQSALALDETLAEAHSVLANFKRDEWQWAEAEREYKRAIELNPNLARAHNDYANFLSTVGRPAESLIAIKRALELDPLDLRSRANEGHTLYLARRYDEAIKTFQDILKIDPNRSVTHAMLADTFAARGEHDEAIKHYGKAMEIAGETTSVQCYLGFSLARSGSRGEALDLLRKLETTKEYISPAELAILYAGLGDIERALTSLEKAYEEHDLQLQFLRGGPHYDILRSDPRFQDLLRRVGLPE